MKPIDVSEGTQLLDGLPHLGRVRGAGGHVQVDLVLVGGIVPAAEDLQHFRQHRGTLAIAHCLQRRRALGAGKFETGFESFCTPSGDGDLLAGYRVAQYVGAVCFRLPGAGQIVMQKGSHQISLCMGKARQWRR